MEKVILYTTHCPRCKGLEMLLQKKKINFEEKFIDENNPADVQIMLDMGLTGAPGLVVDGEVMNFPKAMEWARSR